jgi:septal ring factor EnvC (AmiA/AmiB activator)
MADTLLFRKGPLSGLANLPIKNGAISITTDEPGIYIDHNGKRSRVGDFIVVQNMAELDDYKLDVTDESKRYNAHALYYVVADDALARWDGTKFALINDRSSLVDSLAKLNTALAGLTTIVENQGKNITANTTAIATEKSRAEGAEAALGARIDAITSGTDGTTLAGLKAAIEKEVTDRTQAVAGVDAKANKAQQEVDALEGVVGTEAGNTGLFKKISDEITRATNKENELSGKIGVNTKGSETGLYKLIKDEKDRAMTEDARLGGLITSNATAATEAINDEKERAMAAENKIATFGTDGKVNGGALKVEIDRATTRENAISEVANAAKSKADTNAESIANLANADSALGQRITDEVAARESADTALGKRIDAAVEEAKTHAKQSALNAVVKDVGELNETVTSQGQTISGIQGNITTLDGKITDEIKDRKSEITRVEGLISAETSARETAIANEVTARDTAIETAVNAAKSTLNESISSNLKKINANTKSITDEIARAKAAEKANADNITQLGKDLAAEVKRADAAEKVNAKAIADEKARAENAETQLQTNITNLDTKLSKAISNEADARQKADAKTLSDAKDYADSILEAANAMRYMGTVGDSTTDASAKRFKVLPTTGVEAGDTYVVVGTDFKIGSKACKVGDLIVAIADQSGATYPSDLTGWSHVPTGYDASLDQELKVTATTNGAKAALSSVMGTTEKGSLTIVGNTNSNVKASLSGSTLTVNMEWEEWT